MSHFPEIVLNNSLVVITIEFAHIQVLVGILKGHLYETVPLSLREVLVDDFLVEERNWDFLGWMATCEFHLMVETLGVEESLHLI